MNKGEITPAATKLFTKLSKPKNITTSPAVLKNTPERANLLTPTELKLTSDNTGRVPSANANIVIAPVQKLPVPRA